MVNYNAIVHDNFKRSQPLVQSELKLLPLACE